MVLSLKREESLHNFSFPIREEWKVANSASDVFITLQVGSDHCIARETGDLEVVHEHCSIKEQDFPSFIKDGSGRFLISLN